MIAILSDIHGNDEALSTVLSRIAELDSDDLICLGDVVGYGPNPIECLRIAAKWPTVISGDWDDAILDHDPTVWLPTLNTYIEWMRRELALATDAEELMASVRRFKTVHEQEGCVFIHATPDDTRDFLFPEDIYNSAKLDRFSAQFEKVMFVGHTHIAGVFVKDADRWSYRQAEADDRFGMAGIEKMICNVGSVGQPRDGDPRSSFVLFDGREIEFHRVEYDPRSTIAKIEAIPEIDNIQGMRLLDGR